LVEIYTIIENGDASMFLYIFLERQLLLLLLLSSLFYNKIDEKVRVDNKIDL
jgi:hypothetical protein